MSKKVSVLLTVGAFVLAACANTSGPGGDGSLSETVSLTDIINVDRATSGVSPLASNAKLEAAAVRHARDMDKNKFVGHTGTDGSTVKQRVKDAGYCGGILAENAYRGSGGSLRAIDYWMDSKAHRDNILNSRMSEVGMAGSGDAWVMVLAGRPC